ncbi:barstar family protein [uncultured Oscillibacter sp.]|uniref:barstar family protein n=1 Tax=uncultured Oscillibacter sp. TaxID=876091 RepID=UPI00262D2F53|nr:barstar family protein [uncultured Oscillibacter sp.]
MAEIVLDGLELRSLEEVHDRFAAVLPAWYGRNLDALFDCLTDPGEPVTVRLLHREALENRLGPRGRALVRLLRRAAAETPRVALAEEAEN